MRDGNFPASVRYVDALDAALGQLPAGIKTVSVRSDAAKHQEELLKYCNDPSRRPAANGSARFGKIGFVIGAIISDELSSAVKSVPDDQWTVMEEDADGEALAWCAEVAFVSAADGGHKPGHLVRNVASMKPSPIVWGVAKTKSRHLATGLAAPYEFW